MNKIFKERLNFSTFISYILIVLFSLGLTLVMFWLQPDGLGDVAKTIIENKGLTLFLSFLPILLLTLIIFFIGGNLTLSFSITGFIIMVASLVNRFKMLLRNDPFMPWDITMGLEVAGIAKSFTLNKILFAVVGIGLYILFTYIVYRIIKNEKPNKNIRIIGTIICLIIGIVANKTLYSNTKLFNKMYVLGSQYNQVNNFNSKGFLYSFIYTNNTNKVKKPEGFSEKEIVDKINFFEPVDKEELINKEKPHIFMVMGEAFSELSLNPAFNFDGYIDPLENYKKIKEESIHGEIVVANIGGGTADTEFDVITGINTRHFRGSPFAFRLINGEFDSMAWALESIGYYNEAMHPGYSWFYNRENVYEYLGFEDIIFIDEFDPDTQNKGMYINETATIDELINMFENHLENRPDTPYFNFTITIQNHGPYNDKYLVDTNFSTSIETEDDDINAISNYFEGVIDQDRELLRLVEYMENSEEPIVLIYFGDHLPAFTHRVYDIYYPNIYDEETKESFTRLYKTPFIIYENESSKKISTIEENSKNAKMPDDMIISSNYLGGYLMELLDYNNINPFFDYLNEIRPKYPIILESQSFTDSGESTINIENKDKEDFILFRNWEHYKIFE